MNLDPRDLPSTIYDALRELPSTLYDALRDLPSTVHDALDWCIDFLGAFSVVDWLFVIGAIGVGARVWATKIGEARLGTIALDDMTADVAADGSVRTVEGKAVLQEHLGMMGWLPAGSVPAGSPTAENISNAIAEAPIPQGKWLSALINFIPWPSLSTGFRVSSTLRRDGNPDRPHGLSYELIAVSTDSCVAVETKWGATPTEAIELAANAIYRHIGKTTPAIYPPWAHWTTAEGLDLYRAGIEIEQNAQWAGSAKAKYEAALKTFRQAAEHERENMLVRLRIATCLERLAADEPDGPERVSKRVAALEAYVSVRLRQPTIFEARYRTSVLLALLSPTIDKATKADGDRLRTLLERFELETARDLDTGDKDDRSERLRKLWARQKRMEDSKAATHQLGRALGRTLESLNRADEEAQLETIRGDRELKERLDRAAKKESRRARARLRPLWTICNEGRFRHRFEPTGHERRDLRRAVWISQACLLVRKAGFSNENPSDWKIWLRKMWVGFLVGRPGHRAGWQAHYNAACFYAQLPQARPTKSSSGAKTRRRALRQLKRAIDTPDQTLKCAYVREEDPDLETLRAHSPNRFDITIARLCASEVVVHYVPVLDERPGALLPGGPAVAVADQRRMEPTAVSVSKDPIRPIYRVPICDENQVLTLTMSDRLALGTPPTVELTPSQDLDGEVWIVEGSARVHSEPKEALKEAASARRAEDELSDWERWWLRQVARLRAWLLASRASS